MRKNKARNTKGKMGTAIHPNSTSRRYEGKKKREEGFKKLEGKVGPVEKGKHHQNTKKKGRGPSLEHPDS